MNQDKFEFCSGFLEAMQLLNSEVSNVYAEYYLEVLPDAQDLKLAMALYFEDYGKNQIHPPKDFKAEHWNIQLSTANEDHLVLILKKWFFISSTMRGAPKEGFYRSNAATAFLYALKSAIGQFSTHQIEISPPIWYAMEWDNIALETKDGRYLLHFSHSN